MFDPTAIIVAVIVGASTAVPAVYSARRQNVKLDELHRQVAPVEKSPSNGEIAATLGEEVHELRADIIGLVDILSHHIADRHGPELFDRRGRRRG